MMAASSPSPSPPMVAESRLAYTQASHMVAALTSASSRFATPDFGETLVDWSFVEPLIIGAGGIGCELLHLLALSGFAHLTVIDMDVVELSNLNRQFLFTPADIGHAKSATAAAAVQARCPGVSVTAVVGRVEEQPDEFYRSFHAVLLAVDSIDARRWVNRKMAELATRTTVAHTTTTTTTASAVRYVGDSVISDAVPIIDTGTEGFEGHCRRVLMSGNATPCIECAMYLYNNGRTRATVPLCTLESVPRAPEHCVLYVHVKEWPEHHQHRRQRRDGDDDDDGGEAFDPDNPAHVRWVAERARARQLAFGIGGAAIDDAFALGVVKNIVPAVGFTNAFVAGQAVTELLKWLLGCAPGLNNFAFFNGATEAGVYANVEPCCGAPMLGGGDIAGRCLVCGPRPVIAVDAAAVDAATFRAALIEQLAPTAAAAALLHRGTVSLMMPTATSTSTEVVLPRRSASTDAAACSGGGDGGDAESCVGSLASLLRANGGAQFVEAWRSGAQMATVECFGAADDARVSALVQWEHKD
ncbi:ubiquitin activating enzyme [Novymonas esmeraldas]|uniref:NEDD8-activating enzyme E1 catalytic subunit n=1 Tax=Novymonas esmeraldas TaxID=1808958 RepID=A0AAW0ENP1_9TRYP